YLIDLTDSLSYSIAIYLIFVLYLYYFFFFLIILPPPTSTLFPYTTLFRSVIACDCERDYRCAALSAMNLTGDCEWPQAVLPIERSEEHTSELQSHLNLVCRLLLEKKKNNYI